jgi:UDP-N-acetylglucosamine transferase subunit ALG13
LILVITGSGDMQFSRLLNEADRIAPSFDLPFFLQTGTQFSAHNCRAESILDYSRLIGLYRNATLIVAHASSGPLIYARQFNKPIILMARRKDLGEVVGDYQEHLAQALKTMNQPMRIIIDNASQLHGAIKEMLSLLKTGISYREEELGIAALRIGIRKLAGLI